MLSRFTPSFGSLLEEAEGEADPATRVRTNCAGTAPLHDADPGLLAEDADDDVDEAVPVTVAVVVTSGSNVIGDPPEVKPSSLLRAPGSDGESLWMRRTVEPADDEPDSTEVLRSEDGDTPPSPLQLPPAAVLMSNGAVFDPVQQV